MSSAKKFCYCAKYKSLHQSGGKTGFDSTSSQSKLIVIHTLLTEAMQLGLSNTEAEFFMTIIGLESGFNLFAKSEAGAVGLGQTMPEALDDILKQTGTDRHLGFNPGFTKNDYSPANSVQNGRLALATYLENRARALDSTGKAAAELTLYDVYAARHPALFTKRGDGTCVWKTGAGALYAKRQLDSLHYIMRYSVMVPWEIINHWSKNSGISLTNLTSRDYLAAIKFLYEISDDYDDLFLSIAWPVFDPPNRANYAEPIAAVNKWIRLALLDMGQKQPQQEWKRECVKKTGCDILRSNACPRAVEDIPETPAKPLILDLEGLAAVLR